MSAEVIPLRPTNESVADMVPPMDLDAEAAVISGALIAPVLLAAIAAWLLPEHFYSESHRRIYEAAVELYREGGQVDLVTVGTRLKDRGRIAQVGGMGYISELLNAAPAVTTRSIGAYARTVFDKWRARQAIGRMQTLVAEAYLGVVDVQDYLDGSVRGLDAVARRRPGEPDETNAQLLARMLREMTTEGAPKSPAIPTGLATYDRLVGGLYPGKKTLITAQTGRGKTALALMFALGVARLGIGVQVIVMEETRAEILARLACGLADVPLARWQRRELAEDDWRRVAVAATELGRLPIWIEQIRRARASQIRHAVMLRADTAITVDKRPLGLVVVDNIHQETPESHQRGEKDPVWLREAANVTKALAAELNVPVVELAQMNDPNKGRRGRPDRPRLGCVQRAPQAIESTADHIAAMWEPDPAHPEYVQVEILKARGGGGRGTVKLEFRNERFYEREDHRPYDRMQAQSREHVDRGPDAAPLPPDPDERGTE